MPADGGVPVQCSDGDFSSILYMYYMNEDPWRDISNNDDPPELLRLVFSQFDAWV